MKLNEARDFTEAIYLYLVRQPGTAGTVHEWMVREADPEQRAVFFSVNLAEDFNVSFLAPEDGRETPEDCLFRDLLRLASWRCHWRRVADRLLKHFQVPVTLARLAGGGAESPCRAGDLAHWPGPVN